MNVSCQTCNTPISDEHTTRRCFCSERCYQAETSTGAGDAKDPGVLLVKLFFNLMSEVISDSAPPEILDEVIRMRESWQQDLHRLRGLLQKNREQKRRAFRERAERARREAKERVKHAPKAPPSGELGGALRVLGLAQKATLDDVQQAFRRLALRYHPDKNPHDPTAEERFKWINQAYLFARSCLSQTGAAPLR